MAETLRRLRPFAALIPLSVLWLAPLVLAIGAIVLSITAQAWSDFWLQPHLLQQLLLSVAIGTASTVVAALLSLWVAVSLPDARNNKALGLYLSVPHLAFAIGLVFLIMPAGFMARLFLDVPPPWVTVHDPHGLGLIAALVLKEVPFLLWLLTAALERADFGPALAAQCRAGMSLGHSPRSTAWRIAAPQLLRQVKWPLFIVWVYGCSVVDMALVIGPTQPAPLQLAIWRDLNDAEFALNLRGLAGTLVLSAVLALLAVIVSGTWFVAGGLRRAWLSRGPDYGRNGVQLARLVPHGLSAVYIVVVVVLAFLSFTASWPFPQILPNQWSTAAWASLMQDPQPIVNSLWLALATPAASLLLCLSWFELCAARLDRMIATFAVLALALPAVALAAGQYQLLLLLALGGSAFGVALAQFTLVFAYMFLTLIGPLRGFDERYRSAAYSLGSSTARFLLQVKWPLLRAPLASASAIGFAVSMAQFVSVQLVGAGNVPTLTTEAVTLSSGGNRSLLAAYALALAVLTAGGFALAGLLGRRRGA